MTLNELNPYIRISIPSVLVKGIAIFPRIICDYEIIYVEKGSFTLVYDNVNYTVKEGDVLLLRPNVVHEFLPMPQDVSQPHVHFDMVYSSNSEQVPVTFKTRDKFNNEELKWIRSEEQHV